MHAQAKLDAHDAGQLLRHVDECGAWLAQHGEELRPRAQHGGRYASACSFFA